MALLGRLVASLETRTAKFDRGMDQSRTRVQRLGSEARRASGILRTLVPAATFAGLVTLMQQSIRTGANIADMAERAGVSAERLQEMRFAAEQSGATVRDMDDALSRFNRRLGLFAADRSGGAAKAFEQLGIEVRTATGEVRATEDVLDEVIARLGRMESQAEVSAAASLFFGEDAGPRLAQLLAQGSEEVERLSGRAHDLGIVLEDELTERAQRTAEQMDELNARWRAMSTELSLRLVPIVNDFFEELQKGSTGDFFDPETVEAGTQRIIESLEERNERIRELLSGEGELAAPGFQRPNLEAELERNEARIAELQKRVQDAREDETETQREGAAAASERKRSTVALVNTQRQAVALEEAGLRAIGAQVVSLAEQIRSRRTLLEMSRAHRRELDQMVILSMEGETGRQHALKEAIRFNREYEAAVEDTAAARREATEREQAGIQATRQHTASLREQIDARRTLREMSRDRRRDLDRLTILSGRGALDSQSGQEQAILERTQQLEERARATDDTFREMFISYRDFASTVARHGADAVVDGLADIASGAKTAEEVFRDMARSIVRDLLRMQTQALIFNSIMGGGFGMTPAQAPTSGPDAPLAGSRGPQPSSTGAGSTSAGGAPVIQVDARGGDGGTEARVRKGVAEGMREAQQGAMRAERMRRQRRVA